MILALKFDEFDGISDGKKRERKREVKRQRGGTNPFSAKNFRVRKQSYRLLEQKRRGEGMVWEPTIGSWSPWIGWLVGSRAYLSVPSKER